MVCVGLSVAEREALPTAASDEVGDHVGLPGDAEQDVDPDMLWLQLGDVDGALRVPVAYAEAVRDQGGLQVLVTGPVAVRDVVGDGGEALAVGNAEALWLGEKLELAVREQEISREREAVGLWDVVPVLLRDEDCDGSTDMERDTDRVGVGVLLRDSVRTRLPLGVLWKEAVHAAVRDWVVEAEQVRALETDGEVERETRAVQEDVAEQETVQLRERVGLAEGLEGVQLLVPEKVRVGSAVELCVAEPESVGLQDKGCDRETLTDRVWVTEAVNVLVGRSVAVAV